MGSHLPKWMVLRRGKSKRGLWSIALDDVQVIFCAILPRRGKCDSLWHAWVICSDQDQFFAVVLRSLLTCCASDSFPRLLRLLNCDYRPTCVILNLRRVCFFHVSRVLRGVLCRVLIPSFSECVRGGIGCEFVSLAKCCSLDFINSRFSVIDSVTP